MHVDYMYEQLGDLIKEHRLKMELTQAQLADKVNLSRASIANIESGRQKILFHQLFMFAKCLNIEPSALIVAITPENVHSQTIYDAIPANASQREAEWVEHIMRKAQNG